MIAITPPKFFFKEVAKTGHPTYRASNPFTTKNRF